MDKVHAYFDALDYTVFALMLVVSALIGVYFAFCAKQKQDNTAEYLLGGKKMGIFPISMSLIASYISGIAILGLPAEIYVYGTQYWVLVFGEVFSVATMAIVFLPVFYTLQITSSYEYFKLRFNVHVRTLGSLLFCMKMLLYIPIVVYVPALAFAQVTGFSLHLLIPIISIVCTFYTTLGGLKAVVWTDTLQTILMVAGVVIVTWMGTADVGGWSTVWERNKAGDRLDFFNFDLDPTIRHTFWNVIIGKFFQHLAGNTVNQAMVQRCLAMPTLFKARITQTIFAVGIILMVCLCCYNGLVTYAAFHDCDPVTTKTIGKFDQLLPYFVMKITSHVPALPGIFVAGVFSAALSTMSTGLNSLTGVIYHDLVKPCIKTEISEQRASFIMKLLVVGLGCLIVVLAFVVEKLGGLIQTSGSLSGITAGTLLGMFTLGMLFPWANATGAVVGGISSWLLVAWLAIGSQVAITKKQVRFPVKPVSIEGCDNITLAKYRELVNFTEVLEEEIIEEPIFPFKISYTYYTLIGVLTAIVIGLIVSFLTGANRPEDMDPNVFSPVIRPFLKTKSRKHKFDVLLTQNGNKVTTTNGTTEALISKQSS